MLRRMDFRSGAPYLPPDSGWMSLDDIIGRPLGLYFGVTGQALEGRIIELLEMNNMDARYIERLPDELSSGQKQCIVVARTLAPKPDLIICDEVT